MARTITKHIGEGPSRGEIYAALAYDPNDRFGGYQIKDVLHNTNYKLYFRDDSTYIYSSTAGRLDLVGNVVVTGTLTYNATELPISSAYLGNITVGTNGTGYDVKFYGDTSGKYWMWDESDDKMLVVGDADLTGDFQLTGALTVGVDGTGHDVILYGDTSSKYWMWDESADAVDLVGDVTHEGDYALTGNLTAVGNLDLTGDTQLTGTLTVGVSDTGHDVIFYGATSGKYWMWDESGDQMVMVGDIALTGATVLTGNLTCSGVVSGTGTTDASSTSTAALKTAGGLGVAKKAFIGTDLVMVGGDIDLSTANSGTYDLILKANQADALSIKDGVGDFIVFTTTTGSTAVAITPNTTIAGTLTVAGVVSGTSTTDASATTTAALKTAGGLGVAKKAYIGTDLVMVGGDIDLSTAATGTYDLVLKANQADALSIKDETGDLAVFTTSTGALAVLFKAAITVGIDGTGHDVKLYGDTASSYLLWDESTDSLVLNAAFLDINGSTAIGLDLTGGTFTTAAISMDGATFAAQDHEIQMRNTVVGDKTVICSGSAANDGDIVTAVGADADIADGSIYLSVVDGGGKLFIKVNDVWTEVSLVGHSH